MIGGTPTWQEYPDTRFVVEDDMKQAVSRWSTGFYRTGLTGMMKACSHYTPNLPKRKYQEVLDALESELSDRPDLHFETDRRTIATIDGTVLRFDPFAPRDQDPFTVVPHLAPEDHVVYGVRLPRPLRPVNRLPTSTPSPARRSWASPRS